MIVLDTDVVSAMVRARPHANVLRWFEENRAEDLFLTAITEAELRTGVAILPAGRRREAVTAALEAVVSQDFAGRILPFDSAAACAYAAIAAARRAAGRPIAEADCQIAAISHAAGAAVATRNVRDFEDCGLTLIDPWRSP